MFFPTTDPIKFRRHKSFQRKSLNININFKLPIITEISQNKNKENSPKLLKISQTEKLINNFKPKKVKKNQTLNQKVLREIFNHKIDAWEVSNSPEPEMSFKETKRRLKSFTNIYK